ncbi:MAG: TIGR00303 family protein [Nitrososphaerota archaeon]|nr:TIGR00303 family protein [Nitrososphaerota archaeon]
MRGILIKGNREKAEHFIREVKGKEPIFLCVIGSSEVGKIPGISAAGKNPEFTDYTPPADVELLLYGKCKCISGIPVTPEGIPTPAIITMSALELANIPVFIVNGGVRVKPHVPFIDLGGTHGDDIRKGSAVANVEEVIERARLVGKMFAKSSDYLVIGESMPGGTTTALAVMLAMGVDAVGKVSSSMPSNPHELKLKVVNEGMKAINIRFGDLKNDPIKALSHLGDPMLTAFSGLILGAGEEVPILMAGGTQMAAILAVVKAMNDKVLRNLYLGTTRWIVQDRTSDLLGIVRQIHDLGILVANLNFSPSKYEGLRVYEKGFVKEGVGAGGAAIAAILKSRGKITPKVLFERIERNYERLIGI